MFNKFIKLCDQFVQINYQTNEEYQQRNTHCVVTNCFRSKRALRNSRQSSLFGGDIFRDFSKQNAFTVYTYLFCTKQFVYLRGYN